jgi:hypothetical protein
LNSNLCDAKNEVRQIARQCFIKYKEIFPNKANKFYKYLDQSIQKAITEEDEGISHYSLFGIEGLKE